MNYYLEITLLPNPDINLFNLWSKTFQQIHLGLVEMQDDQGRVPVGVAFPNYVSGEKYSLLGDKLRLFAPDETTLARFDAARWLERLRDYVHCTSIRPVPASINRYATYHRVQAKTNKERLARRYAKRHGVDFATALHGIVDVSARAEPDAHYKRQFRYNDLPPPAITGPFIRMDSLSGGHSFRLCIKKTVVAEPSPGGFSTYGLSRQATVPEF